MDSADARVPVTFPPSLLPQLPAPRYATRNERPLRAPVRAGRSAETKLSSVAGSGQTVDGDVSTVDGDGDSSFRFVDLFAGIGGFHAVLAGFGGTCVFASEIDDRAAAVYERNWATDVAGDIIPLTTARMDVPEHEVLAAGFPCQPFSKSGFQRGMEETRGTLFWNIARVLAERRPGVILLENVRNLAGPRHRETWATIIATLRQLGYKVSAVPVVFSPHLLPPELGGTPQVRDRVFIPATYVGRERAERETQVPPAVPYAPVLRPEGERWDPQLWDLETDLPLEDDAQIEDLPRYRLTAEEERWIDLWDDFVQVLRPRMPGRKLPGFPIWADAFVPVPQIGADTPRWKANFLRKNSDLYNAHADVIDAWLDRHDHLAGVPASRRKLEWQAQQTGSLWDTLMHFRPSGIRAKRPTYVPALVAITQTSIIGSRRRRLTPRETARLQGLDDSFDFGSQPDAASYKQMGNGVNVGAASYVLREHVRQHLEDVTAVAPGLARAVVTGAGAGASTVAADGVQRPDAVLVG
ncbi:DNA cytosine methyltransferase [Georgenia sp. TF02-10]|uniref:DNA cytosine methyltransferase n=1 Tax=Georgenia sp. TF02-10 TaxID=2917725 RepID=UPI001FA733E0|nr:DNA cytosine methyltransferase [Georgenia sp. TF02-10]UNX55082.1 DNA cytosine methyltransferase [Georgenia sp. TF02-10]